VSSPTQDLHDVTEQALKLARDERLSLMESLLDSIDPPGEALSVDEWREACGELIRTRLEALSRGEVIDDDWRSMVAQLREEFAVGANGGAE
jgi:hypothetical protein